MSPPKGTASKRRRRRRDGWRAHPQMYRVWHSMRTRCGNPNHPHFARYGGRGIRVCRRWRSFAAFMADMGERPTPKHTLERIDNDGPYTPRNCRWATRKEQANNKSNNRHLTFGGLTLTLAEWAAASRLGPDTLSYRLRAGWPLARALSEPPRPWSPGRPRAAG